MVKCEIIYNNNEVMTVGFGNSKKQAERNASIQGCYWLERYKASIQQEVEDYSEEPLDPEDEEMLSEEDA